MIQDLALSAIRMAKEQTAQADAKRVGQYCNALTTGQPIPPVTVFAVRKGFRLLAGIEQLLAAQRTDQVCIQAEIQTRSDEEKRRAVAEALRDPITQHLSNRSIGGLCAVDDHVVARQRRELYMEPRQEVVVQRGGRLFTRKLPARPVHEAIPLTLHESAYVQTATIPDEYADVILTVPPVGSFVPVEAHAERMARHLKADGMAYLWFSADDLSWLVAWQQALEKYGLSRCQYINWTVSMDLETLDPEIFPRFEIILALSRQRRYGATTDVLRGYRSASVHEPSQVYRKPLKLVSQLLIRHGEAVLLDPFVQSGVTLLGADRAGLAEATGCLLDVSFAQEVRAALGPGQFQKENT